MIVCEFYIKLKLGIWATIWYIKLQKQSEICLEKIEKEENFDFSTHFNLKN
jgi:hypothetical protein